MASSCAGASGTRPSPSQLVGSPFSSPQARGWPWAELCTRQFFLFSPQAASALTPSCPAALSSPHPTRPHQTSGQESAWYSNSQSWQWLIRLRGDLSLGDKAKMRVRTTREQFGQQCLEGAAVLEVGKRLLYYLRNPRLWCPASVCLAIFQFQPEACQPCCAPDPLVKAETSPFDFMD